MVCVDGEVPFVTAEVNVMSCGIGMVFLNGDVEQTGKELRPWHCLFPEPKFNQRDQKGPVPSLSRIFLRLLPISRSNL